MRLKGGLVMLFLFGVAFSAFFAGGIKAFSVRR